MFTNYSVDRYQITTIHSGLVPKYSPLDLWIVHIKVIAMFTLSKGKPFSFCTKLSHIHLSEESYNREWHWCNWMLFPDRNNPQSQTYVFRVLDAFSSLTLIPGGGSFSICDNSLWSRFWRLRKRKYFMEIYRLFFQWVAANCLGFYGSLEV